MKKLTLVGAVFAGISYFISIPSHAALVDNGGGLIYDTVLNITWAQPFSPPGAFDDRKWGPANTWAAGLTLGGVSGWRLPYISVAAGAGPVTGSPIDCSTATEAACHDNELGYMFYQNFGGTAGQNVPPNGAQDVLALFPMLEPDFYWSGTEFGSNDAWHFNFGGGRQGDAYKLSDGFSWAVHAGDIHPIPIPAAIWLFGCGFLGLVGIARRRTGKGDTKISMPRNNDYSNTYRLSGNKEYQANQQHQ
jgi:hypothetical protein